MIRHENFYPNVDVDDKYGLQRDVVGKNAWCRLSHLTFINRRKENIQDDDYESRPLAAAFLGVNNTAAKSGHGVPIQPRLLNRWTDIDEQQLYIDTKPNCYMIIAKPGTKAFTLGEALAKKLKCIHICPRNVILDEIIQDSSTGKCIDFHMRHYKECKINSILSIIIAKLNSPTVRHRGFILSGIPLVTSKRTETTYFKKRSSEETVLDVQDILTDFIANFKKKKKKGIFKSESEGDLTTEKSFYEGEFGEELDNEEEEEGIVPEEAEEEEEEEDPAVELPKFLLEPCQDLIFSSRSYYDSKIVVLINQINQILKTEFKPDIIIHITCPDEDVLTIKHHKYLDYGTDSCVIDPFLSTPVSSEERWPSKYSMSDFNVTHITRELTEFKYHVRPPVNYVNNATEQLCNYKNIVRPYLEEAIKDIEPKLIIKVDGRTPASKMLHNISERLEALPLVKFVLLPKPLLIAEPPEEMEEFLKMVEEQNAIKYENLTFKLYESPWYARCPVELKKRRSMQGKPKYAVSFFKHVYLLFSLENLISFWKNPRPYLHYQYLEPTCRIVVMGTKSSGKTMISECLSWLFDTPILSFDSILEEEKQKRYDTVAQSVFSEIIPTIEDARYEKWQKLENERLNSLQEWQDKTLNNLKKFIAIFNELSNIRPDEQPSKLVKSFQNTKKSLSFLPFIDDIDQCTEAYSNKSIIEFAPAELTVALEKPYIPLISDPDVIEAIATYIEANDLQKDIELTSENVFNLIRSTIKNIDEEAQNATSTYGKYIIDGFSPDTELWDLLSDSKTLPDYTIVLMENRLIDDDLMEHYKIIDDSIKHHRVQFLQASDPLVKIKKNNLQDINVSELSEKDRNLTLDIKKFLFNSVIETIDTLGIENEQKENDMSEEINALTKSIENFRNNWENTKPKIEDNYKSIIEVELENKTDVEVVEEVLLKLRQAYGPPCEPFESEEVEQPEVDEEIKENLLTFNESRFLCELGIFCPIAYFDYGVMWEGKTEIGIKHSNKMHYFSKEECLEKYRQDYTKYQFFNKPFKKIPPWRICVIGKIGSGKTTISKFIAKELGLMHIDYEEAVNNYMMPKHFKKVGRRYENNFTDVSLEEEAVETFQMVEESEYTNMTHNELEMRRMLYEYFEKGTALLPLLVQNLLKKLWFEDPFVNIGFVIDGFPKCSQDVEEMVDTFCIPDLIIDLECTSEFAIKRLSPVMFAKWKMQQNEAKRKAKLKFEDQKSEWRKLIRKNVVAKLIFEDILDEVMAITEIPVTVDSQQIKVENEQEAVGAGEPEEKYPFIVAAYNEAIELFPAPEDTSEWENAEDAQEKIDSRIETIFEFDEENIESLKEILMEHKIKTVSLDATESLNKVQRKVLIELENLRNRSAFFEQTWIINHETADILLAEGFYFLSRFNRMCPVFIYKHPNTLLNLYKVKKREGALYPVIHRCYVYYIQGEESVRMFRMDPLKYIISDNILSFHQFPLKLAVIGPPKSGKSTLAIKLAKHYGLICVSKGKAIRNVLENMHWTKLATIMNKALQLGDCITNEQITNAVQTALFDYRTAIHGFMLDGFPDCPTDAMELEKYDIYPLIVFDLATCKDKLLESSQREVYYDIIKYIPPYSKPLIECKFSKWSDKSYAIRDFIRGDCQNIITLNGNECKWQCYKNAKECIENISPKIHFYIANQNNDVILPADVMCISNATFRKRMSAFETFCPICLQKNILKHSSEPVDKNGVVQFKGIFYWICPDHMNVILELPSSQLVKILSRSVTIPEIPAVVKIINPNQVYENGICIVTYAEHLPAQILKTGSYKFAANYKKKIYLFCDSRCLTKFLEKPHMYFDITVFQATKRFPQISLKKLPDIGYLEQSVGDLLTKACCAVNVVRPKYPGLSVELSGLLYVALYLKVNNPLIDEKAYKLYKKAFQIYETRSKYIVNLGLRLRSMDNPFVSYPKFKTRRKLSGSIDWKPAATTSISIPPSAFETAPYLDHVFTNYKDE